jgi:hypothetical protein
VPFSLVLLSVFKGHLVRMRFRAISSPGSGGSFPLPGKILIIILLPIVRTYSTASFFICLKDCVVNNHIHFDIGIVDHFNAERYTFTRVTHIITLNQTIHWWKQPQILVFQTYFAYHQWGVKLAKMKINSPTYKKPNLIFFVMFVFHVYTYLKKALLDLLSR